MPCQPRGTLKAPLAITGPEDAEGFEQPAGQRHVALGAAGSGARAPAGPVAAPHAGPEGGARQRPEEFVFLHHFAGRDKFGLGEAVVEEATSRGLRARHISIDLARSTADDLLAKEPYGTHLGWAAKLEIHGFHAGYPCTSFSRVRFRPMPGMPGPVRDMQHLYGFPWNSRRQQQEAEEGTMLCERAVHLARTLHEAAREAGIALPATLENPAPPENDASLPSSFWLDCWEQWFRDPDVQVAQFPMCAHGMKHRKETWIAGILKGMNELEAKCSGGHYHEPLVGKERTAAAADYPEKLCRKLAKLVVDMWCAWPVAPPAPQVTAAGGHWLRCGRWGNQLRQVAAPLVEATMEPATARQQPRKAQREAENAFYVGGMRNPNAAVARLAGLKREGSRVRATLEAFFDAHPEAVGVAQQLGNREFKGPDEALVHELRARLRQLWNAPAEPHVWVEWGKPSPVQGALMQAWLDAAGDPERCMASWASRGAPLGIEEEIEACPVFPPVIDDDEPEGVMTLEAAIEGDIDNYTSATLNEEDTEIELKRLEEAQFVRLIEESEARERYGGGTVSRVALILREKADGSKKRRLVVDLRRSGGNALSKAPQRIVLPRVLDVINDLRDLTERCDRNGEETNSLELASADLADAYQHWRVRETELKHCLTRHRNKGKVAVWVMLAFGFKTAPLIFGRLAAAGARLAQSVYLESEARLQLYLDDPLWGLRGCQAARDRLLAAGLWVMLAIGLRVAWHKGARGQRLDWIGVQIGLTSEHIETAVPPAMTKEILEEADALVGLGMVGVRRLKRFTGRLSWAAGIVPRMRWAVAILYATVAAAERDARSGIEERRRLQRPDARHKEHLVPAKRCALALEWVRAAWRARAALAIHRIALRPGPALWTLVTDASPWGVGACLVHAGTGVALVAVADALREEDEAALGIKIGESSAQAVAEALAILVGAHLLRDRPERERVVLSVRSDSSAALAMVGKLSSGKPALNFLGAELSLLLESLDVQQVQPLHIPGSLNEAADWLSRRFAPGEPKPPPESLALVKWREARARGSGFYQLPTPGARPEWWGGGEREVSLSSWPAVCGWG